MTCLAGDIVAFYSTTAGKRKYHLCITAVSATAAGQFLFLNSGSGRKSDCILSNADFPCISPSATGLSVVSFSTLVRVSALQLPHLVLAVLGSLQPGVARQLEGFAASVPTLTAADRRTILAALAAIT